MTKRDAQLRDYMAESRVYGMDGEKLKLTEEERKSVAAGIEALHWAGLIESPEEMESDWHIANLKRLLERTQ